MQGVPFKEGLQEGIFEVLMVSSDLSIGPNILEVMVNRLITLLRPKTKPVLGEALLLLSGQELLHMLLIPKK